VTFRADNRANFQPVKALSFEVALSAPPAFHVILSAAANDIATLHGREGSREAIMHRGKALALVSKGLAKTGQRPGDDVLTGVALFTGNEVYPYLSWDETSRLTHNYSFCLEVHKISTLTWKAWLPC
jgi:hypothetical protein